MLILVRELDLRLSAQERLFMSRVAINYAQAKRNMVWRMVKGDFEGIRIDISHHILPALTFVGFNDAEKCANKEAGRMRDDTIGVRKVRIRRAEKEGSESAREGDDEYTETFEFYEPTEEPDFILHRKKTTPIHMGISVPIGRDDHHEEFIVTDFWSYEGFSFSETKESESEYKLQAGDPNVDKYFATRRGGGNAHKNIESQEDRIREYDGAKNGKEAMAEMMLDFTECVSFLNYSKYLLHADFIGVVEGEWSVSFTRIRWRGPRGC